MSPGLDILTQKLKQTLITRQSQGRLIDPPSPSRLQGVTDFSSNDTLSLSTSGILTKAFLKHLHETPNFTIGSTSSRALDGTKSYLLDLEIDLARFHNAEAAIFFNSGYDANVAVWSTLPQPGGIVLYDEYIHGSIHDGMRRGRATTQSFRHNDPDSLQECLQRIRNENYAIARGDQVVFIAVESFYSMDGDVSPLNELLDVAYATLPRGNFIFPIDEAHSNGLVGPNGSGLVCHYGLEEEFPLRLNTQSSGAVFLCTDIIKFTLLNYARSVIYSTAPSFVAVTAVRAAYDIIASEEGSKRRTSLQQNLRHFYHKLTSHPDWPRIHREKILFLPNEQNWRKRSFLVPIVAVVGKPMLVAKLAATLERERYFVNTVHYPIVPKGTDRIRLMVHADNTLEDIKRVVEIIMRVACNRSDGGPPRPHAETS